MKVKGIGEKTFDNIKDCIVYKRETAMLLLGIDIGGTKCAVSIER